MFARTGQMLQPVVDVVNDFVGEKENRKQLFGNFSANDIPSTFSVSPKSAQHKIRDKIKRYGRQI